MQGSSRSLKRSAIKIQKERIHTFIGEQRITVTSTLTISGYLNNFACYHKCFWWRPHYLWVFSIKRWRDLKKWLNSLADLLKRLAWKAVEAWLAIVGRGFGPIFSVLSKTVGFVDKHTWALITFASGLIEIWLIQKVKKSRYDTELGGLFMIFVLCQRFCSRKYLTASFVCLPALF